MSTPEWLTDPELDVPGVWVTVVGVRGSTPRDPGACMWVGERRVMGTIGGGGLERAAIEHARDRLRRGGTGDEMVRYPLGLAFGQCCGGVAFVHFQDVSTSEARWWRHLIASVRRGTALVRATLTGSGQGPLLVTADGVEGTLGDCAVDGRARDLARMMLYSGAADIGLRTPDGGDDPGVGAGPALILHRLRPVDFHLALFGAGHVGRALVRVLAGYPCRIVWVDSRPDEYPDAIPANVVRRCVTDPTTVVAALPAGCHHLVMTHSHALDLDLCERILMREDLRFCGLIGSVSKRNNFNRRLRQRGVDTAHLERLTCPIGMAGVRDKHPTAIAIAVAAQLLQHRHTDLAEERHHGIEHVGGSPIFPCTAS